jgi:predicted nucleic acid-binding protein
LSCEQALDLVEEWMRCPAVILLRPGDRHWALLRELLQAAGTAGNLTTDAHLAALAIEYDAELYSSDNDFARFQPLLRFVNPLRA